MLKFADSGLSLFLLQSLMARIKWVIMEAEINFN